MFPCSDSAPSAGILGLNRHQATCSRVVFEVVSELLGLQMMQQSVAWPEQISVCLGWTSALHAELPCWQHELALSACENSAAHPSGPAQCQNSPSSGQISPCLRQPPQSPFVSRDLSDILGHAAPSKAGQTEQSQRTLLSAWKEGSRAVHRIR